MRLILRADVDHLGRLGDVVTVKPGFGRNFLLPKGLAMPATRANEKVFEQDRKKLQKKMDSIRFEARELADRLAQARVIIRVRVGEADRLYGSVTSSNIVDALAEMGIELDRKKLVMSEPIRALGDYVLTVKLHPDVHTELKVSVVRHDWDPDRETVPEAAPGPESEEPGRDTSREATIDNDTAQAGKLSGEANA